MKTKPSAAIHARCMNGSIRHRTRKVVFGGTPKTARPVVAFRDTWSRDETRRVVTSRETRSRDALPFFLCVLLALGWMTACSPSHEGPEPLVVGMELKYPPFEMTTESGEPAGVSVDLALALGEYLERPVRIENMPFDGLIPSLKTGKIDLIISSMTATEERAQSISFSEPYLTTGLALLVPKDSTVQSIHDLDQPGKSIAVKLGTTGQLYAEQNLKKAGLLVLAEETACVLEVVQRKADGFIYDQMSIYQNWKKYREATRPILEPFKKESWAVGLRQGDDELREQVNAFLRKYREQGGFEKLGDKYLSEQKRAFAELGYPFVF